MQSSSASHSPAPVCVRHENASLGRSRVVAERSSRNITASETIAATISADFASGGATTDAADIAAIARQIRATRPAGTRRGDVPRAATDGKMKRALIARTTPITAVVTKALRQLPKWANTPPTRGPIRTDMLQLVDISAMVRDQACSGNVPRTST